MDLEQDPYLRRLARIRAKKVAKKVSFSNRLMEMYPRFPGDPKALAEQVSKKNRVGTAKGLDLDATVILAVAAYARHQYTSYDQLLASGLKRPVARGAISFHLNKILVEWAKPLEPSDDFLIPDPQPVT